MNQTQKQEMNVTGAISATGEVRQHRTLPRQIIKWIQGLDLSYSVKDYRKDMNNGFLIAEIFSRYHPGKIQMHSFDSSQNSSRKKNNWDLLELFFVKNTIGVDKKEYDRIVGDDPEQLFDFICRIYTLLTQRKLVTPPLASSLTGQATIKNENLTNSFVLRDKGLEKLDGTLLQRKDGNTGSNDNSDHSKYVEDKPLVSPNKKTNFLRVPSKQISPIVDNNGYQIDVKSINIRNANDRKEQYGQSGKFDETLSKKSLKEQPIDLNYVHHTAMQEEKQNNEREIFDYLRDMLATNIQQYPTEKEAFEGSTNLTETFARKVGVLNSEFVNLFLKQILASREGFISQLFKDQNEIWKFFAYFLDCLHRLEPESQAFGVLLDIIGQFGRACERRQSGKTKHIFNEYLLPMLVDEVKMAPSFLKKSKIIRLLYDFCGEDLTSRKASIMFLKEQLKDNRLFMQFLAVLVEFETNSEGGRSLVDDMVYYANQYLFSGSVELRTLALKIYSHVAKVNFVLVLKNLYPSLKKLSQTRWWENVCQVIGITVTLIERITTTKDYVNLIKHPGNLAKCYNPENERLSNQMKEEVEELARTVYECALFPNEFVKEVALCQLVPVLAEHKLLARAFVELFLQEPADRRLEILNGSSTGKGEQTYIFNSAFSQRFCRQVDSSQVARNSAELLTSLVQLITDSKLQSLTLPLLELLSYSLDHANIKSMNVENFEQVCNVLMPLVLVSVCDQQLLVVAAHALQKLSLFSFNSDIKISEFAELLSATLVLITDKKLIKQLTRMEEFLRFCNEEHERTGSDSVRRLFEQVRSDLAAKGRSIGELDKLLRLGQSD